MRELCERKMNDTVYHVNNINTGTFVRKYYIYYSLSLKSQNFRVLGRTGRCQHMFRSRESIC